MEINLPSFKKSFTGPIAGYSTEIEISAGEFKHGEIILLGGPGVSAKKVFLDIIRGIDRLKVNFHRLIIL